MSTRHPGWRENQIRLAGLRWWTNSAPPSGFWFIAAAAFLFNLGISIFLFLYNLLMLDLGFREESLGFFASCMAIGAVAGAIPMGMLASRFGCRKVLSACLVLTAAAFAARVSLIWTPAQIALSFVDGVALCGWTVCLSPSVARLVEERRRPLAFSLLFAIAVASGSLGGFVGGHMPEWFQWAAIHLGTTVSPMQGKRFTLLGASAIIALGALPPMRLKCDSNPLARARYCKPSRFLARFLVATVCWGASMGAFNPFVNVFFSHYLSMNTQGLGSLFSLAQLAGSAAVLLMPIIVRRTGLLAGILVVQLATAACLGLIAAGPGLVQMQFAYCGFMAAQLMCDPAIQTLLMSRVPAEERSNAAVMSFLVLSLGQALAAAIAGVAFARFSHTHVITGIALAAFAAAISFHLLCRADVEMQPLGGVLIQPKAVQLS